MAGRLHTPPGGSLIGHGLLAGRAGDGRITQGQHRPGMFRRPVLQRLTGGRFLRAFQLGLAIGVFPPFARGRVGLRRRHPPLTGNGKSFPRFGQRRTQGRVIHEQHQFSIFHRLAFDHGYGSDHARNRSGNGVRPSLHQGLT